MIDPKNIKAALASSNQLLNVLTKVQANFILDAAPRESFDQLLQHLLQLTGSNFGLIGEVLCSQKQQPYLRCFSLTDISWDEKWRRFYNEHAPAGLEFHNLDNLLGAVITSGQPVLANDAENDARRGGTPAGHPPIDRFLGMPFSHRGQLIGIVCIANRTEDYTLEMVDYLQPFLATCASLTIAYRGAAKQREAENRIRESEHRYRTFVQTSSEGIYRMGFDEPVSVMLDEDEQIERLYQVEYLAECNDVMATMYGYQKAAEMIGKRLADMHLPSEKAANIQELRRFIRSGYRLVDIETIEVDKDGGKHYFLNNAVGIVEDGHLTAIWGTQRDISEQKKVAELLATYNKRLEAEVEEQTRELHHKNNALQQALYQLKEAQNQLVMREKMASLGQLIAGIAHEINNPIGAVNSAADVSARCLQRIEKILAEEGPDENSPVCVALRKPLRYLQDNIAVSAAAGQRIATIVESLRSFIRLDEAEYQKFDLHDGLESTLAIIDTQLKDRITVEKEYGQIPPIYCSAGQINQVFLNVLINAIQAIKDTGTIHIRSCRQEEQVCIKIKDSGIGIPADKLNNIFDFGFSMTASRVKMGTGLSTAYSIVQKHQGNMDIESAVGSGTTVTICLPI